MPRSLAISRTQALVLGFFAVAWVGLVVMLAASAGVRDVVDDRMPGSGAAVIVGFLVGLLAFLTLLSIGVVRRWRWVFWLVLVTFAAGVVRVPVAVLQLTGGMEPEGPEWYVVVQGLIGVVQVAIAVAMVVGYRRAGVWGSF